MSGRGAAQRAGGAIKTPEQLVLMLERAHERQASRWRPLPYRPPTPQCGEVTGEQRDEVVRWLAQLNKKLFFCPETFALAVTILDRFLHTVKCRPRYLRLVGVACFYVAAKTVEEDERIPQTIDIVHKSEVGCSVAEIHRMERLVLDKLKWDVGTSTPLAFLHILYALLWVRFPRLLESTPDLTPSRHLSLVSEKLAHAQCDHRLLCFPPATQAAALLSMELQLFRSDWLPASVWLQGLAQAAHGPLVCCRTALARTLATGRVASLARIYACRRAGPAPQRKRKVSALDESDDDDDNIFDGLKRLYEEGESTGPPLVCVN